jgi:hypothetical protein
MNTVPRSTIANSRALAVQRVKDRLVRDSFPRIQMALLVALTGGFGLLASFTLLKFGVDSMALRYPMALALAYLFFLFLIWLWLWTKAKDYLDVPDITGLMPQTEKLGGLPDFRSGGGGDFGGGGASGTFGETGLPLEAPSHWLSASQSPRCTLSTSLQSCSPRCWWTGRCPMSCSAICGVKMHSTGFPVPFAERFCLLQQPPSCLLLLAPPWQPTRLGPNQSAKS